jgi:hypothetical protein
LVLGPAVLILSLVARAWGAAGSSARGARAIRAVVCASSMLAAGFLVLEAVEPVYLESFGL